MDLDSPSRAQLEEPTIDDVHIVGDDIVISYSYAWHVYNGCDNYNGYGEEDGVINGRRIDDYWVFDRFVEPEGRSTYEEF
jgi:hypothetical protein